MKNASDWLLEWGVIDPEVVGQREYEAVYSAVHGVLDGLGEGSSAEISANDDPKQIAIQVLDQIGLYAMSIRTKIERSSPC